LGMEEGCMVEVLRKPFSFVLGGWFDCLLCRLYRLYYLELIYLFN